MVICLCRAMISVECVLLHKGLVVTGSRYFLLPARKAETNCSGSATSFSMRSVPFKRYSTAKGIPIPVMQSSQNSNQLPINSYRTMFDMWPKLDAILT
ncbi:hypothetical protein SBA3_790017 [Candidatus Sulfopaludibacter sp. SbA3]|nr:hypothetical protein SBA3_790017 [Candidatus Sulfopaludibacter sp. SbA3]